MEVEKAVNCENDQECRLKFFEFVEMSESFFHSAVQ